MNNQVSVINNIVNTDKASFEAALPTHIPVDKFMQVCNTAAMMTPELNQCSPSSLLQSFLRCAKDGLYPDNKEAALVIFNKKRGSEWIKEAQYLPMIDGVLKRLRQSGEVPYVTAKVVYEGDIFEYYMDMEGEKLEYRPTFDANARGDLKLVFAMAKLKSGESIVEVMTKEEVEKIMYLSKSAIDSKTGKVKEYSVWNQHFDRMSLKTVTHRLAKRLPNSSEVMEMLEREIQIKDMKNGEYLNNEQKQSETALSSDELNQIKNLVIETGSDEKKMFAFVSSSFGKVVNRYEDLNERQATQLLTILTNKKKASQEAVQGELVG
jgi:recombination protein RecT